MKAAVTVKENYVFRRIYRKGKSSRDGPVWASPSAPSWEKRWCATVSAASCGKCTGCTFRR